MDSYLEFFYSGEFKVKAQNFSGHVSTGFFSGVSKIPLKDFVSASEILDRTEIYLCKEYNCKASEIHFQQYYKINL